MKFECIVVYENGLDKFYIGHGWVKVKVTLKKIYKRVLKRFSSYINTKCHLQGRNFGTSKEADIEHVCLPDTNTHTQFVNVVTMNDLTNS